MKKLLLLFVLITTVMSASAQTKIAHVDSQKLMDTLPSRKKAIAEMTEIDRRGTEELKLMDEHLKKEYYAYMDRQAKEPMSQDLIQYEEGRLSKMQSDIQARQGEIERILQGLSAKLNEELLESVKQAVDIVAKRKGLNYVIDESTTLFANGPDITNEVIVELLRIDAEKTKTPPKAN